MPRENPNISVHDQRSIPQLRSAISGKVITSGDAEYDETRSVFYGKFDAHPAMIVQPANARDVVQVIGLARESGIEFAVRGGGHSLAGYSTTEGGILLDLSSMKGLEIDVRARSAWAEADLTADEYTLQQVYMASQLASVILE